MPDVTELSSAITVTSMQPGPPALVSPAAHQHPTDCQLSFVGCWGACYTNVIKMEADGRVKETLLSKTGKESEPLESRGLGWGSVAGCLHGVWGALGAIPSIKNK